jgi:hypothetical protein
MKALACRREAFTCRELVIVVTLITALVVAVLAPAFSRARARSARIECISNLKELGIAYRVWSNDNGDHYPAEAPQTNGGWRDLLKLPNAAAYTWTNFAVMGDELGQDPRILACPADERKAARTFANLANTNISYFVGPGANDTYPQAILGGDRNLGPGTMPAPDYGFSPANGKGNDVIINGPVCWTLKMHSEGSAPGCGNIILGDGSAQQTTSGIFNLNWRKPAIINNEPAAVTNIGGIRLIFP